MNAESWELQTEVRKYWSTDKHMVGLSISTGQKYKISLFFYLKIMIKMRRFASFLSYLTVNNESLGFWTVCWTEEVFWIITVGLLKGQFTQITKRCLLLLSVLLFLVSSQSEFTGFYLVRFLNNHLRRFTCDDWNVTNRTFEVFLLEDFHFLLLHTSTAPRFGEYNAFFFYSITLIC